MNHRLQIRLPQRSDTTPKFLGRVKIIAGGVLLAAIVTVFLVVALVVGSVIAAGVGILVIAALAVLIVRGTIQRARR